MPRRKTISLEDKKKIVKLYLEQYGMTKIGKIMDLNIQTVSRIVHQYLKDGELRDHSKSKGEAHEKRLSVEQLNMKK